MSLVPWSFVTGDIMKPIHRVVILLILCVVLVGYGVGGGGSTSELDSAAAVTNVVTGTGDVILSFRDYADTTDDDMDHVIFNTNCVATGQNVEECDLTISTTRLGLNEVRMQIFGAGDVVIDPIGLFGGNLDTMRHIVGLPKLAGFSLGSSIANGTVNTTNTDLSTETPTTEWSSVNITVVLNSTGVFRKGSASLQMIMGLGLNAGDGVSNPLDSGDQDWSGEDSIGFWFQCLVTTSADDWQITIVDATNADVILPVPALTAPSQWQWMEVDISGVSDVNKDVVTDLDLTMSAAGATTFAGGSDICFMDYMWVWDAADESALGFDVYEDGVLVVYSMVTATGGDRIPIVEAETTDYFIHYEAGNDFLVPVSNLSTKSLWGMAALEP